MQHLVTVALLELVPAQTFVVVRVQKLGAWRSVLDPGIDAIAANSTRPVAHDQHTPAQLFRGALVDAGVRDQGLCAPLDSNGNTSSVAHSLSPLTRGTA